VSGQAAPQAVMAAGAGQGSGGAAPGRHWPRWWPGARGAQVQTPPRWVVLDVESSGLDPARDCLLAIAAVAVAVAPGRPHIACGDSFEVLLGHPAAQAAGAPVDKANILVHGLGVGAQARGTPPVQALQAFEAWVAGAPCVGFHVDFDRVLIERAFRQHLGRVPGWQWLDLEPLAALSRPGAPRRALDDWLADYGIPCAARHQAAADALATAELLLRLWPFLSRERATTFEACRRLAARRRWLG
jgi:DNA polymerase-3 subunit epsilon